MPRRIEIDELQKLKELQANTEEIVYTDFGLEVKRGSIVEAAGQFSSGKTSFANSVISQLTNAGELCAIVDGNNGFDPYSASKAQMSLNSILWVKCHGDIKKAILSTDYLIQSKNFGAIWLNLNQFSKNELKALPKTYWYRYRTRIRETSTILLITCSEASVGPASQLSITFRKKSAQWEGILSSKLPHRISTELSIRNKNTQDKSVQLTFCYADA